MLGVERYIPSYLIRKELLTKRYGGKARKRAQAFEKRLGEDGHELARKSRGNERKRKIEKGKVCLRGEKKKIEEKGVKFEKIERKREEWPDLDGA